MLTEACVHVTPTPEHERFHAVFFGDWAAGLAAARAISQAGVAVSMLRVSNADETDTQLRIAGHESAIAWLRRYLGWRRLGDRPVMMLFGVTGSRREAGRACRCAGAGPCGRRRGGGHRPRPRLGRRPLRRGLSAQRPVGGRLLRGHHGDRGALVARHRDRERHAAGRPRGVHAHGERALAFSHLSHVYAAGCSLYMTVIWRRGPDYATDIERWRRLKRDVSRTIVARGGTISHQHGVGRDHAPYLDAETGASGRRLMRAALAELDPEGMMNPHKLWEDDHVG